MGYFISFDPQKTNWRIATSQLIENLLKQWPDDKFKEMTNPARKYSYEFVVGQRDREVACLLNRRETSIYMDGELVDCPSDLRTPVEAARKFLRSYCYDLDSFDEVRSEME